MDGDVFLLTYVGITTPTVSSIPISSILSEWAVPPLQSVIVQIKPMVITPTLGDPRLPYIPNFSFTIGREEYSYDMSPAMMAGLQVGTSTYAKNIVTTTSPYNMHPTSTSTIKNPSRMTPKLGGLGYIPHVTSMLNTTFFMSTRQQMDKSNSNTLKPRLLI